MIFHKTVWLTNYKPPHLTLCANLGVGLVSGYNNQATAVEPWRSPAIMAYLKINKSIIFGEFTLHIWKKRGRVIRIRTGYLRVVPLSSAGLALFELLWVAMLKEHQMCDTCVVKVYISRGRWGTIQPPPPPSNQPKNLCTLNCNKTTFLNSVWPDWAFFWSSWATF